MKTDTVDLFLWRTSQNPKEPIAWPLGNVNYLDPYPASANKAFNDYLSTSPAPFVLFWDPDLGAPDPCVIQELVKEPNDIWHAGLRTGYGETLDLLKYSATEWMFIINPADDIQAVSWRLSLRCCLIRAGVFNRFGFLNCQYKSLDCAGLEFGNRCIKFGAIIKNTPELLEGRKRIICERDIKHEDKIQVVSHMFGKKWATWTLFNTFIKNPITNTKIFSRINSWGFEKRDIKTLKSIPIKRKDETVSIILPTVNRYDYIPGCLTSIRNQVMKPDEIIIIDQNKLENRKPEIYEAFHDLPITVIWQDKRGQCTARNAGLLTARGNWLFFIDDDSIYPPDALQKHWSAVKYYLADASTGVSVPPREYKIPEVCEYYRLASNLDTGNCLIRKDSVIKAGGFDLNYDFGKGADQDLGMRVYLQGGVIIHNPEVIRIHFKAEGGLRDYGVLWNNRSRGLLSPKPPITITYFYMRYLPKSFHKHAIIQSLAISIIHDLQIILNKEKSFLRSMLSVISGLLSLPILIFRVVKSVKGAKKMISNGPILLS